MLVVYENLPNGIFHKNVLNGVLCNHYTALAIDPFWGWTAMLDLKNGEKKYGEDMWARTIEPTLTQMDQANNSMQAREKIKDQLSKAQGPRRDKSKAHRIGI